MLARMQRRCRPACRRHSPELLPSMKAAGHANPIGREVRGLVSLVLTGAEMPRVGGHMLTRHIKDDRGFVGIPLATDSSPSLDANRAMASGSGSVPAWQNSMLTFLPRPCGPCLNDRNRQPERRAREPGGNNGRSKDEVPCC